MNNISTSNGLSLEMKGKFAQPSKSLRILYEFNCRFYIQPKIHKQVNPGRQVTSNNNYQLPVSHQILESMKIITFTANSEINTILYTRYKGHLAKNQHNRHNVRKLIFSIPIHKIFVYKYSKLCRY